MLTLVLFAALAIPPQQINVTSEMNAPVVPDQVLAWQLEGLTQEEIQDEVRRRGLTQCADEPLLNALSAARANPETVKAVRHAKAPCTFWRLGLRLPGPNDYLYEVAGAILWSDWGHALHTMQIEADKQPRNPDVRLIYAHLLRMSEDWIMAYGAATEAVALAPQSPYAHALRSTICYHAQLPQCAMHEAVQFVKLRPDDAAAYIVLGHANELLGYDAEALLAYCEARRLHPGYAEIHEGLGRVHARQGEFELAVAALEEAIRLDGNEADYYAELASVYQAEGYMPQAIKNWQKAKELEPDREEISLALANAYLAAEHYAEAIREYKELLVKAPEMERAKAQLVKALRADGRTEEANEMSLNPVD